MVELWKHNYPVYGRRKFWKAARRAESVLLFSIDKIGDTFDNAMAKSVMGLFKTELHRNPAALDAKGGKGLDDLESATCG